VADSTCADSTGLMRAAGGDWRDERRQAYHEGHSPTFDRVPHIPQFIEVCGQPYGTVRTKMTRHRTDKRGQMTPSRTLGRSWTWIALGVAAAAIAALVARRAPPAAMPQPVNMTASTFLPTVENTASAPGPAPDGMVWIPGGEFSMGAADPTGIDLNDVGMHATTDSRPVHRVYVDAFWMDATEVTNAQFAAFVKATGYVTVAERVPRAEDLPTVPPESLAAGSAVFTAPGHPVPLNDYLQWWSYVKHADWRHPLGPDKPLGHMETFPVVHVAYADAAAFAQWAGKRLPTEAEWEFAARGGLAGDVYPWGNTLRKDGRWMANSHQGHFPDRDTDEDAFAGIAPVAQFPANAYGLYDVAGNVWEWVSDWYRSDYYGQLAAKGGVARNPQGPDSPFDPEEPGAKKRVHRGGSFLCTEQFCSRYMVGTRGKGEIDSPTNHLGFRLVRSPA